MNFEQLTLIDTPRTNPAHIPQAITLRARLAENGGDMSTFTDAEMMKGRSAGFS